MLTDNDC